MQSPGPTRYLSSYQEAGLVSKKQWIVPDTIMNTLRPLFPLFFLGFCFPVVWYALRMPKNYFLVTLLVIFFAAVFFSDLMSSIVHISFVDNAYSTTQFEMDRDGYMVVPTMYGYSSCHHFFPSNWKDIDDINSMITVMLILIFIFVPMLELVFHSAEIKLFFYIVFLFLIITPVSHKYMHERHHKRYVPWYYECLFRCQLLLSKERHVKHHENDVYDWGLLNGWSDMFFNQIIYGLCYFGNLCPIELMSENFKKYEKTAGEAAPMHVRFVGDIEGRIVCRREGTRYVLIQSNDEMRNVK